MVIRLSGLLILFSGIIQAVILPINETIVKNGNEVTTHQSPYATMLNYVIADSGSEYSMFGQSQECLAYNPVVGGLQFVCRNYIVSGALDVWQSDSIFSMFILDQQIGTGRYPHSIASFPGPHISFPYLISGSYGGMGAQYESGSWYSSIWDSVVDIGGGNVNTHRCIGKQLPNTNIIFIGVTDDYEIIYRTWNYSLSQQIAGGVVAPATSYFWGFDVNGGTAYVFWYDANLNVYYKTTTDGINWSSTQTYNLVWPNPFTNNLLYWTQMAVTDAGNPVLVFDMINGDDTEYPYVGKVYVSTASGQPCIEVGITTSGAACFYPTIAAGGNYVVVLFGHPRSGTGQYTFWDIYYNYSADNGATWSTPRNLTGSITDHNNCLWQIAKRLNPIGNGQFFFVFGTAITDPMLDLYWNINNGTPTRARWYVARNEVVGISEEKKTQPSYKHNLTIIPNPVVKSALISFYLTRKSVVRLEMYDAAGRLVKTLTNDNFSAGNHTIALDLKSDERLNDGVYFIRMKTSDYQAVEKLIIRK